MGVLPFRIQLPAGLATTIGALPQFNPFDASRVMRDLLPRLPAGPTVPVVIDLTSGKGPTETVDLLGPLRLFLDDLRGRVEPIVLSLTGPVTINLRLIEQGVDSQDAAAMAVDAVERGARRVLEMASQILPGAPVLLFLEEPGLANSMHPTFPLSPDEIEGLVAGVVEPISADAMVGVQVSGRADWALLLRTGIAILGAPVSARLETAAVELQRFLDNGGFIAWGAVPTDEPLGSGVERLWRQLSSIWADLAKAGIDPLLLRERSIITPAAGLADFGLTQAALVMKLTAELSERVFNQVIGARLSIGA